MSGGAEPPDPGDALLQVGHAAGCEGLFKGGSQILGKSDVGQRFLRLGTISHRPLLGSTRRAAGQRQMKCNPCAASRSAVDLETPTHSDYQIPSETQPRPEPALGDDFCLGLVALLQSFQETVALLR